MVKSTVCSSGGPRFNVQYPYGSSQLSVTLVPGESEPPSGLQESQAYMWYIDIYADRIPMHVKLIFKKYLLKQDLFQFQMSPVFKCLVFIAAAAAAVGVFVYFETGSPSLTGLHFPHPGRTDTRHSTLLITEFKANFLLSRLFF